MLCRLEDEHPLLEEPILAMLSTNSRPLSDWRMAAKALANLPTEGRSVVPTPVTLYALMHSMLLSPQEGVTYQQAAAEAFGILIASSMNDSSHAAGNFELPEWMFAPDTAAMFAWCWQTIGCERAASRSQQLAAQVIGNCLPCFGANQHADLYNKLVALSGIQARGHELPAILDRLFGVVAQQSVPESDAWQQAALKTLYFLAAVLKLTCPFTEQRLTPRLVEVLKQDSQEHKVLTLQAVQILLFNHP